MLIKILFFFGPSLLVVFCIGLVASKPESASTKLLVAVLFACFVWTSIAALSATGLMGQFPHFNKVHLPFLCITGPLWYFYIRSLLAGALVMPNAIWHSVPAILCVFLALPFYMQTSEFKIEYSETTIVDFKTLSIYIATRIADINTVVYLCITVKLLRKVDVKTEPQDLYLKQNVLLIITLLALVASLFRLMGAVIEIREFVVVFPTLVIFASVFLLYFFSNRYPGNFYNVVIDSSRAFKKQKPEVRECTEMEIYLKQIQDQQLYLNSEITIAQLAEILQVQPRYLSRLINIVTGSNFQRVINEFRIRHAETLFVEQPELSILEVAYASGFNSKSAFYNSFVKFKGVTPVQFKKSFKSL